MSFFACYPPTQRFLTFFFHDEFLATLVPCRWAIVLGPVQVGKGGLYKLITSWSILISLAKRRSRSVPTFLRIRQPSLRFHIAYSRKSLSSRQPLARCRGFSFTDLHHWNKPLSPWHKMTTWLRVNQCPLHVKHFQLFSILIDIHVW